jgi:flagellar biosynthesis/type III secretory pathway ATPase
MKLNKSSLQRWRVTRIIGARGREVCELQAKTADEAIKRAIREYGIDDPHQRMRLAAYRVA